MPRSLAEVTPAVRYAWSAVRVSGGTRGTRRQILSSEFGDVPDRYTDAKSRRNYAGTSPVTRASGTRRIVLARHARKKRLADAIYLWAFSAISASPRRPRLLRLPPCRWRHPPPGPQSGRQPPRRIPPWLPAQSHPLQRAESVGPPSQPRNQSRRLTPTARGISGALPAVASHAISCADSRHGNHSPGIGAYEEDGGRSGWRLLYIRACQGP